MRSRSADGRRIWDHRGFDLEARPVGANDANAAALLAIRATRIPDAVADLDPSDAIFDRGDHDHGLADQARGAVVEQRVAAGNRMTDIPAAADVDRCQREECE